MKINTISVLLIIFACVIFGIGQTPTPTPDRDKPVTVTQGFVDDATKAFDLVATQREALARYAAQTKLSDVERANVDAVLKTFDELLAVKDKIKLAYADLVQVYAQMLQVTQNMIQFQNQIINMLQAKLLKPKGFWQKFLDGVKEIIKAAIYITIGVGAGRAAKIISQNRIYLTIPEYG